MIGEGYPEVIRASGSHGKFDLIGIDAKNKKILLVQCKVGRTARSIIRQLDYQEFNGTYKVVAMAL